MFNWSYIFLILTLTTGVLGFVALDRSAASVSQALSAMFFVLTLTSVINHEIQRREH